ncbi:glycosyltransferase [Algoriphagus chordae]|uniref:Glycosyltransferase involved in cell wall biosynthesis n=1 Tax=Algoriphagus chordae TaxID=237019 RepID=A0A2W7QTU9_9BACT|nr:glycosyltransferase [Algoriphagus chordae]PZX52078.1 glycosyltransferase involved in cell wall biosynthesis [Algoriphagus chordae]
MRILNVISSMNPLAGGTSEAVRNTIVHLNTLGIESEVVSLDDPTCQFLSEEKFVVYALGPSKTSWNYSDKLRPWLERNLQFYDRVVIHGLWQYCGFAVHNAFKQISKEASGKSQALRYYIMPHGMLDPYFQEVSSRKFKAIRNNIYWFLIENKVIKNAQGLLFTCEEEKLLARKPFQPYEPNKEDSIGFGIIEPPAFSADMADAFSLVNNGLNEVPYFLFLSRIHDKKGVDLLLRAYEAIALEKQQLFQLDHLPKLVIAGPGLETEYGVKVKRIVDQSELLRDRVIFVGMLQGDAKWGAFYGCEAFILPSHQENFGIAVVEALACSKPVLISNKVNIWREIENSNAGIVANDDLEGTITIIRSWLSADAKTKNSMNRDSRLCYECNFSIGPSAENMLKVISQ